MSSSPKNSSVKTKNLWKELDQVLTDLGEHKEFLTFIRDEFALDRPKLQLIERMENELFGPLQRRLSSLETQLRNSIQADED